MTTSKRKRRVVKDPTAGAPKPKRRKRPSSTLLLRDHEVAARLGISRSTLHKLRRQGLVPMPAIRTKGLSRWSGSELERWEAAGCPNVATWERIKTENAPETTS